MISDGLNEFNDLVMFLVKNLNLLLLVLASIIELHVFVICGYNSNNLPASGLFEDQILLIRNGLLQYEIKLLIINQMRPHIKYKGRLPDKAPIG